MYFLYFKTPFSKFEENANGAEKWFKPILDIFLKYKNILINPISFIIYLAFSPNGLKIVGRCMLNFVIPFIFVYAFSKKRNIPHKCPSQEEAEETETVEIQLSEKEKALIQKAAIFKDIFKLIVLLIVIAISICSFYIYKTVSSGESKLTFDDIMRRSALFVLNLVKIVDFNEYSDINTCKTLLAHFEKQAYACRCILDYIENKLSDKKDKKTNKITIDNDEHEKFYVGIRGCVGTYAKNVIKLDIVYKDIEKNIENFNNYNISKESIEILDIIKGKLNEPVLYHYDVLKDLMQRVYTNDIQAGGGALFGKVKQMWKTKTIDGTTPPTDGTHENETHPSTDETRPSTDENTEDVIHIDIGDLSVSQLCEDVLRIESKRKEVESSIHEKSGEEASRSEIEREDLEYNEKRMKNELSRKIRVYNDILKKKYPVDISSNIEGTQMKFVIDVLSVAESDVYNLISCKFVSEKVKEIISRCIIPKENDEEILKLLENTLTCVTRYSTNPNDIQLIKQCAELIYKEELNQMPKNGLFYLVYLLTSFISSVIISFSVTSNHKQYIHASTILVIIIFAIIHYILYFKQFAS
jgi:hypothetical protein